MRIGVDLGGTKIEAMTLGDDGTIVERRRIATPRGDYRATLRAIGDLVDALCPDRRVGLGIGSPGSVSPVTGRMRNANSTVLNGEALVSDLAATTKRDIRIANDADCFALAEALAGAGRGVRVVFGVIIGTGVGSGIIVDGKLLDGPNRIAGEWGHNPLPAPRADELPGPKCYCGRRGCIEAWCSGPAVEAAYRAVAGRDLPLEQIAVLARTGDHDAADLLDHHLDRLARSLAGVINILDPDAVVLGGGLSNLEHLYARLPDALAPYLFSDCARTPILPNQLGDSAGAIGAAWLWP
ncbi:MAG: ROK family protein [Pseudomonadota bacterium]